MPLIYELRCTTCGVNREYVDVVAMAVLADGTAHPLPHPGERWAAKELGTSLLRLRMAGRLHAAFPRLCTSCGTISFPIVRASTKCETCSGETVRVGGTFGADDCGPPLWTWDLWILAIGAAVLFGVWQAAAAGVLLAGVCLVARIAAEDRHDRTRRAAYERWLAERPCWSCGKPTLEEVRVAIS